MVSLDEAQTVKQRHSEALLRIPGVCGVGTERDEEDNGIVVVHVDPAVDVDGRIPEALDGVPLRVIADGPFTAFSARRHPGS
jgi:hypothetical protein